MAQVQYSLWISICFFLGAAGNIFGILFASRFLTREKMFQAWPGLFGRSGCIAIMLWGLAYASVAFHYRYVPYLILVFAFEKLFYSVAWIVYLYANNLASEKPFSWGVFSIVKPCDVEPKLFGALDIPYTIFFFFVFFSILGGAESPPFDIHGI